MAGAVRIRSLPGLYSAQPLFREHTMAYVDWAMQGIEVSHCNCNIGCPCQFNALPSHGFCCAYMFMQVDKGHFGKVKLDGLKWGGMFSWPGPIHMGNGT